MAEISQKKVMESLEKAKKMKEKADKYKDQGEMIISRVVNSILGFGVSYGLGVAEGYHDGVEFQGVPMSIIVAGLGGIGAFVFSGGARDHALTIMDAGLWSYGHALGIGTGREMKMKHEQAKNDEGKGGKEQPKLPPPSPASLPQMGPPAPATVPANPHQGMTEGTRLE